MSSESDSSVRIARMQWLFEIAGRPDKKPTHSLAHSEGARVYKVFCADLADAAGSSNVMFGFHNDGMARRTCWPAVFFVSIDVTNEQNEGVDGLRFYHTQEHAIKGIEPFHAMNCKSDVYYLAVGLLRALGELLPNKE